MLLIFRKNHEVTFLLLALLSDQKRGKSHLRGFSILLKITFRVHELVARAMRGKRVRQRAERKSAVSRYPQFQLYHACEHITRDSRADSCTHCLHARIIGVAGVNLICALTEWRVRFLFFLLTILGFYLVGVGAVDDPLLSRGEHRSPRRNIKKLFF